MAENGRDIFGEAKGIVDKDRFKSVKLRQDEERQRKLEEMKAQVVAAQQFKEQKEVERRRKMEDARLKEDSRRQQVVERKRAINMAERDRLESILKRNQEREARIEAKRRNERSSIAFAFGSSTPRNLDPTDMTVSFWGYRRATSTQNITCSSSSLTRRQSERDLDMGSKKRATSASGLERSGESSTPSTPAGLTSGFVGRRRTDLVPTVPSRDGSLGSSRKLLSQSPASSRPSSSLSQQSTNSVASSASVRHRPSTTPRRPRPASIAITGVSQDIRNQQAEKHGDVTKPPLPRRRKSISKSQESTSKQSSNRNSTTSTPALKSPVDSSSSKTIINNSLSLSTNTVEEEVKPATPPKETVEPVPVEPLLLDLEPQPAEPPSIEPSKIETIVSEVPEVLPSEPAQEADLPTDEMTASFSKPRITTEEEAKAALAERRRLAREEAERIAEQKRLEEESAIEAERARQQLEEEQIRIIIEQQRAAEKQRLEEAIRETQRRVEEERQQREEELRLKREKEDQAREEAEKAEKQKAELQEKLKNEEKEREVRRKRVEAIMSRTRGKNANPPSQQNSEDRNENKSENALNGTNKSGGDQQENGTTNNTNSTNNGKNIEIVDNIIPDDTLKNANTVSLVVNSSDSINSNNSWQASQQFGNFVCNNNS